MYKDLTPIAIEVGAYLPDIYMFNELGILWFGKGVYETMKGTYHIVPAVTYAGYNHNGLDVNKCKNIGDIMYTLWKYYGWR